MFAVTLCLAVLLVPADLDDLARRYDITWTVDPGTGRHTVRAGRLTVVFAPGIQTALVNGAVTRLSSPVTVENGRVRLPADLTKLVETNVAASVAAKSPLPKPRPGTVPAPAHRLPPCTIAIDAGHGGVHAENRGRTGLLEKDINLDVSLHLQRILEGWGATVVMTRTDDRHFHRNVNDDLDSRVDLVNRARPDLFVSVHTNHAENSSARGFEAFIAKNASGAREAESRELANLIRSEMAAVWDSPDRGTKEANYRVLNGTRCPAVLVELEFLSHRAAERQLGSQEVRRRLAESIAEAVRKWLVRRK